MNLQNVISQADVLVPNEVSTSEKIVQLNSINQDFFNVVKIPMFHPFTSVKDQGSYVMPDLIRFKNIEFVACGVVKYKEFTANVPNPMQNVYTFDDGSLILSLRPAPYQNGLMGTVRFNRIATSEYIESNLNVSLDAPVEYHWTYVLALASFLANTQDDAVKASNYENQYKAAWNVAAQNYAKEVTV